MMKIKICYKSYVFIKVLRAKLTGTWEGGGIGGKNIDNKFLIINAFPHPLPLREGLTISSS